MKAIILAAGRGTRIPQVTKNKPKCLVKINKKTILERQIFFLNKLKIKEIVIVKGFKKNKILIKQIKYIENKNYKNNEQLDSFFYAQNEFTDDLLVLFSDIIYDFSIISKIYNQKKNLITLAVDKDWKHRYKFRFDHPLGQADKVKINKKNNIIKIGKKLKIEETNGEFLGIFKVSKKGCKVIIDNYREYKKHHNTSNKQLHDFFKFLINKGINISSLPVRGKYMEIDTFNDYKLAKKMFKKNQN